MPGKPSKEQFDMPDPENSKDHGRTNATQGSATPKAPNFQGRSALNPIGDKKFQGYEKVNDASGGGKFGSKRPSGLETS